MKNVILIGVLLTATLIVSGCGTDVRSTSSLPTLLEYSDQFRNSFADELDEICKIGAEKTPKTCQFIQDAIELRAKVRAAQE